MTVDITCPDSFTKAFTDLPDASDKPSQYRLKDGTTVEIAYLRQDGHGVTTSGRWISPDEMISAKRIN